MGALNSENRQKYGIGEDADGVVIVDINPTGAAAKRGLREGDIIKRIDKRRIDSPGDVKEAIKVSREAGKKSILLLIERGEQTSFMVVPLDS